MNLKRISKPFELLAVEAVPNCSEQDFEQVPFDRFGEVAVVHAVQPIIEKVFDQNF